MKPTGIRIKGLAFFSKLSCEYVSISHRNCLLRSEKKFALWKMMVAASVYVNDVWDLQCI